MVEATTCRESIPPSAILVRASGPKLNALRKTLSKYPVDVVSLRSQWDEDAFHGQGNHGLPIQEIAARKASLYGLPVSAPSIGTDVMQVSRHGEVIHKPRNVHDRRGIAYLLKALVGGDEEVRMIAHTSVAIAKGSQGVTQNVGIPFSFSPISEGEILSYIYGEQAGEHFQKVAADLQRAGVPGDVIDRLAQGLTLKELQRTNGAIRWLNPIFSQHLLEINHVASGDERFDGERDAFFSAVTGAPHHLLALLKTSSQLPRMKNEASLIPDLPETWVHYIRLRDGNSALVRTITPDDYNEVSTFVQANIAGATYAEHGLDQQAALMKANSPDGIADTCKKAGTIAYVSQTMHGEITGYIALRIQNDTAQIRRLHTKNMGGARQNGIGTHLVRLSEGAARKHGIRKVMVQASGNSPGFYEKIGYQRIGVVENAQGNLENAHAEFVELQKII